MKYKNLVLKMIGDNLKLFFFNFNIMLIFVFLVDRKKMGYQPSQWVKLIKHACGRLASESDQLDKQGT